MRSLERSPSERFRRASGQGMVEFALVLPLLALILAIALDFSRAFYCSVAIASAAREGARYGSMNPADTAGIVGVVVAEPRGTLTIAPAAVAIGGDRVNSIRVTVSHQFPTWTPLVARVWNGALSASSEMPVLAQ